MKLYIVVSEDSEEALERQIEGFINDGWDLQGGVSVCAYPTPDESNAPFLWSVNHIFSQALFRDNSEPPPQLERGNRRV